MGRECGVAPEREDRRVVLPDGRRLAYAEFGAASGRPLVYLHGWPASHREAALADGTARGLGLRLIAVDRPGYGGSDPAPGRTLAGWPADVTALADALGLGPFLLMGVSGGGPFALACARALPQRVVRAAIVCGLGPLDAPEAVRGTSFISRLTLALPRRAPCLVGPFCRTLSWAVRHHPGRTIAQMARDLPPPDRATLGRPEVASALERSFREAFRTGTAGAVRDLALYNQPWGVDLGGIATPVHFFHGEQDTIVPAAMARDLSARIPGATLRLYPEEGHHSLAVNRAGEILEALIA